VPFGFISPEGAQLLARDLLGCRLPSLDEWKSVIALGLLDDSGANLRDPTWQRALDHFIANLKSREYQVETSPFEQDAFWPESLGPKKTGRETRIASERDDGVLWFAPAGADGSPRFRHLLGNVAEYLADGREGRETDFYVVGGSALSPRELDARTPFPARTNSYAPYGFSDVGVRLAFDAPGSIVGRSRLLRLIDTKEYLRL
jgi:hypothetical protein